MSLRTDYDKIYRSLSRVELQSGAGDLEVPDLFGFPRDRRWLGFYTEDGLRVALERYGLFDRVRALGYEEVRLELLSDDPEEHLLRIWSVEPSIPSAPLVELVARRDIVRPSGDLKARLDMPYLAVLNIEWLQLQRPDALFTKERPPLPGQRYPGLGIGRDILELLRQAAKRLGLDALVTVPSYFHNAYFYSAGFQYMDPREQGTFLALCRDLLPQLAGSVPAASWALAERMVRDESEAHFDWFHDVMIAPLSDPLNEYVNAREYHAESGASLRDQSYAVEALRLRAYLEQQGIDPLVREKIDGWIGERV